MFTILIALAVGLLIGFIGWELWRRAYPRH